MMDVNLMLTNEKLMRNIIYIESFLTNFDY